MGSYIDTKRANRLRNLVHDRVLETIEGFMSNPDQQELRDTVDVLVNVLFDEGFVTEDNALILLDREDAK